MPQLLDAQQHLLCVGRVLDYFPLSEAGRTYRMAGVIRLLRGAGVARSIWPSNEIVLYSSMQLEGDLHAILAMSISPIMLARIVGTKATIIRTPE